MSEEIFLLSNGSISEEELLLSGTTGDFYQRLQNLMKHHESKKSKP